MRPKTTWCGLLAALLAPLAAWASEPAAGTFTASRSCEAFQSFRKATNPGGARVAPGTAYRVREVNGRDARWVRRTCTASTSRSRASARSAAGSRGCSRRTARG